MEDTEGSTMSATDSNVTELKFQMEDMLSAAEQCYNKSASATDSMLFGRSKSEDRVPVTSNLAPNAEYYDMSHKRRGVALVFNNIYFKRLGSRYGAGHDTERVVDTFAGMGFDVRVHIDMTLKSLMEIIKDTSEEDHTDADCLAVVAMSHGKEDFLQAADVKYPVNMLWHPFIGHQCPSLAGKPKLFFIQGCRGTQIDDGMQIMYDVDSVGTYSLPIYADIFIAYASYESHYSFRNVEHGSWFIQTLCDELDQNWRHRDLIRIMTGVIRRVAIEFQSYSPEQPSFHRKKQVPCIVSMLTRLVHFNEKVLKPEDEQAKELNNIGSISVIEYYTVIEKCPK